MPVKALLLALALGMAVATAVGWLRARTLETGRALFAGERALPGRILGHESDLPAHASRCSNCHGVPAAGARADEAFAPPLRGAELLHPRARRGGPPSTYSADALCTLLRSGVDPAHVMIARTMPRYRPGDADCAALWAYLESR